MATKNIKNYTTTISYSKTIAEIQNLLIEFGALGIAMEYDDSGNITSLFFRLKVNEQILPFKLPARPQAVYNKVHAGKRGHWDKKVVERRMENSKNIAWRIVKDWLEMQLTMIQLDQAEVAEVFLAYLATGENRTLYDDMKSNQFLLPKGNL